MGGGTQIWVKQLPAGAFSRLSFDVENADRPVWTPDGRKVAFMATRNNRRTAWMQRADGSDSVQPASPQGTLLDEVWFDPLGRYTVYRSCGGAAGTRRLLILQNGVDTTARTLLQSRFDNFAMVVSPDGQWLAYVSNESGAPEVYVRPFPDGGLGAIRHFGGGRRGAAVAAGRDRAVLPEPPRRHVRGAGHHRAPLQRRDAQGCCSSIPGLAMSDYHRSYDVHPDGKRFLMLQSGGRDAKDLNLVFNWPVELDRLEQAAQ